MGTITLQSPTVGQPNATEDPKIPSDFNIIQTWANGNVDGTNILPAYSQSAGVNVAGTTVKGSTIVPGTESTTSGSYALMPTPDRVSNIVLTSAGLLRVWYFATWNNSAGGLGQGKAAIFIGSNQLKAAAAGAPAVQEIAIAGTPGQAQTLSTSGSGLITSSFGSAYTGDVTTGQIVTATGAGGHTDVFAAAGTYNVSVQYLCLGGSTTFAASRRLYVEALSFS